MIRRIAHVCISSTDLEATRKFYCEGLGFRKVFDFIRGGQVVGFYLEVAGGNFVEVFLQDEVDTKAKAAVRHFCLEVEDLEATRRSIQAGGYEVSAKKMGADHTWQAWVTDPSGVRIEMLEYTARSTQVTGEACVLG